MFAVYTLELRRLNRGPTIWVIAAILQITLAWYCLSALEEYLLRQSQFTLENTNLGLTSWLLANYSFPSAFALLLTVPALSMQSIAADRQQGSLKQLLVSPISISSITVGKYAALATVLIAYICLALFNLLCLAALVPLDLNAIMVAHLSLAGLTLSAAAIGLLCSSTTSSPATAAFSCCACLLLLWLAGGSEKSLLPNLSVSDLAIPTHLGRGLQGVIHSADLSYFLVVIIGSLCVAGRKLSNLRLHGAD